MHSLYEIETTVKRVTKRGSYSTPCPYTGAGGGGVGGGGQPARETPSAVRGNGGVGFECTWTNGNPEWLAGGGGGAGNSSEYAGNGHSGGGRGCGQTPLYPYQNSFDITIQRSSSPYTMEGQQAKFGTGSGGGGGSYWHYGSDSHASGEGGQGAPGRVIIRWRTA